MLNRDDRPGSDILTLLVGGSSQIILLIPHLIDLLIFTAQTCLHKIAAEKMLNRDDRPGSDILTLLVGGSSQIILRACQESTKICEDSNILFRC
ncbi:MAG: hypothetical protein WAT79_09750 [Saprospiraceae bacterium]